MRLDGAGLAKLFTEFRESAFRLETLQVYTIDAEQKQFGAWRAGRGLPERSMRTSPWLQNIARTTTAGKRWSRVHVVQEPLSDYLEFELVGMEAHVAAGEDVRVASLAKHPYLAKLEDFWAFDLDHDKPVVVWMRYDADGGILERIRSTDPDDIDRCWHERNLAMAASVPLHVYRAQTIGAAS